MSNIIDWPSTPDTTGKVPPLIELISAPEPLAGHVMLLMNGAGELAKKLNGKPEGFQIPLKTPFGLVSIPGIIKLADNSLVLLFSHKGEWASADYERLMRWTLSLRTQPSTMNLRIEVLSDLPEIPKPVLETVDNRVHTIAGLCSHMLVDPMNPALAASNVLLILSHTVGRKVEFDRESLLAVDAFVQQSYPPIAEDWTYRNACVTLFGQFLGECINRARGGAWAEPAPPFPAWMKQVQIGQHTLNPMGRASKFLRDPKYDSLAEMFDLSTPESMARTEAAAKKAMEGQNYA